jgi:hypothetical protein
VTFTKVLTTYHTCIHPSIVLLYLLPPIPGTVSTGLIVPFRSWCIIFHHIHPTTLVPYPPTDPVFVFKVISWLHPAGSQIHLGSQMWTNGPLVTAFQLPCIPIF